jgi:hypothetical protein
MAPAPAPRKGALGHQRTTARIEPTMVFAVSVKELGFSTATSP